jgi:hypothetical protein
MPNDQSRAPRAKCGFVTFTLGWLFRRLNRFALLRLALALGRGGLLPLGFLQHLINSKRKARL